MALFPEMSTYYKGRTHTSLVVSEGMAPAERYIPSVKENVKFQYAFGPEGNQGVVIPKGKAVAIAGMEWDYETEKHVPALKIADGTKDAEAIIGVNHHNVYERVRDRFSGNQPTVITREYIEVPLFGSQEMATAIQFGAAWAPGTKSVDIANAIIGKYIAIDKDGNYTLADDTHKHIIGQCLGVETDLPPAGYLQYFMEMDDERWKEFQKQMSYAPSPGRTKDADWNNIGTYPLDTAYLQDRKSFLKNFQAGIPFLTDGYFKARAERTYVTSTPDAMGIKVSGHVTVDGAGLIQVTDSKDAEGALVKDLAGAAVWLKLPTELAKDNLENGLDRTNFPEFGKIAPSNVAVTIGTTPVSVRDYHVDYTNNTVVVYLDRLAVADVTGKTISVAAVVLENQVPGIPTGWDFQGSYGAARILLSAKK